MKKFNLILILVLVSATLFAQIPKGYYDGTEGQEGYTLKTTLHNIIKGHNNHGYDGLYDGYQTTDVDNYYENDGTVLDMYSENPTGSDPYNWTHNNDHCGQYQHEGDCWNREHLIPQSFFGSNSPMVSDIHFVVPSDGKVNGNRSNYPIAEVSSASWTSLNGSKLGSCSSSSYSGTVFEPIDEFKGDIARMLLYFVTRYEGQLSGFNPSNSRNPLDGSEDRGYEQWYIDMLMNWHEQDPVSQRELDRNDACYDFQNNRNPFIDHPEWVQCIWSSTGCNGLYFTSSPVENAIQNIVYTYEITYKVDIDDETLTCTYPDWLTFTKDESTNTAILTGTPNSSHIGGTHNVVLTLTEAGSDTQTQEFTINVTDGFEPSPIFEKDFDDNSLTSGGWTAQSITGSGQMWEVSTHDGYSNGNYAKMSGFDGSNNAVNEDWLISPGVNFDNYEEEELSFVTSMKQYGTDNTFTVYILENYDGTSDPNTATLNDITSQANLSSGVYSFTNSGNIDVSAYSGTVYLAFKYTSGTGDGRTWEVEDILLMGSVAQNISNLENIKTNLFPNPTNANVILEYNLIKSTNVEIAIYDIVGNKIETIEQSYEKANNYSKELNFDNYKSGIYFISIKTDYSNTTQKIIKN